MKRIKYCVFLIMTLMIMPSIVLASGGISVSKKSITIDKGKTDNFTISADNAAGKIEITTSDGAVAKIDKKDEWLDNNSVTVTVTGASAGTATITVKLIDVASYDNEELTGTYTVAVNVKEPGTENTNTETNKQKKEKKNPNTGSVLSIGTLLTAAGIGTYIFIKTKKDKKIHNI